MPLQRDKSAPKLSNNITPIAIEDRIFDQPRITYSTTPSVSDLQSNKIIRNHNPITNPLPINIQNPYLLKQVTKLASERQNRLATLASANLVN
jgi:hypothetical protein